jgi:hypothetical protein
MSVGLTRKAAMTLEMAPHPKMANGKKIWINHGKFEGLFSGKAMVC